MVSHSRPIQQRTMLGLKGNLKSACPVSSSSIPGPLNPMTEPLLGIKLIPILPSTSTSMPLIGPVTSPVSQVICPVIRSGRHPVSSMVLPLDRDCLVISLSGHTSEAGALEEESSAASLGMAHQPPRKLSEVIVLMSWVMPKPTPSEKLESAGWEGEERTGGAPWKQLRALNKSEKRGYGSSTDEEPDPSRAVFPHTAGEDSEVQLWRPGRTSFLFRQSDPTRPGISRMDEVYINQEADSYVMEADGTLDLGVLQLQPGTIAINGKKVLVEMQTSRAKRTFADIQQKVLQITTAGSEANPLHIRGALLAASAPEQLTHEALSSKLRTLKGHVDNKVVDQMVQLFAAAIPLAGQELLSEYYDLAKASPLTHTKDVLRREQGLVFNGAFVAGAPSRAVLLIAGAGIVGPVKLLKANTVGRSDGQDAAPDGPSLQAVAYCTYL
ncbi:hypothetical protein WJX82_001008 [Trebouxia sp. C0006]